MILDSGKTTIPEWCIYVEFESVVILDSGKTKTWEKNLNDTFESVVILDSGKTNTVVNTAQIMFESVVILDRFSKRGQNLWRFLPPFFCLPGPLSVKFYSVGEFFQKQ